MYIRKATRRYKDKTYTNYLLVESHATPKGPRQTVICSLGDLKPRPREDWLRLAHKVEAALVGQGDFFSHADAEVKQIVKKVRARQAKAEEEVVAVRTEAVRLEEVRQAGPVHVGCQFWHRLGLEKILKKQGFSERARTLACGMTMNRLIHPSSEHAMPSWLRRTALAEIRGADFEQLSEDSLYRMLDRLHPQRTVIERALAELERDLFNLDGTVFFYDLTSTYFEGQALANAKAKRGYSRDKRGDCKQVVVGLVVGQEGFPQAHEVFEGSRQDRQSLSDMLDVLQSRVSLHEGQTVVVDRGMAYDENLAEIKSRGLHYVVASRQTDRNEWLDELEDSDGFEEVIRPCSPTNPAQRKTKIEVKKCESGDEVVVLCRSEGRVAKDRAIRDKQEARLCADLAKLAARIEKGRLVKEAKIHEAIGRLKERYPRVARYWRIAYDANEKKLSFNADEKRRATASLLDGSYLLKTDRKDLSADEAWRIYSTLTRAEQAFRDMKSPLAERPIFHHLEHRVETHIFLCVLAYHLLVAIENTLRNQHVHTSWRTVRETLESHQVLTVVLPTDDGAELHIRKASAPEPEHRELYDLLHVPHEVIHPRKHWVRTQANPQ